MATAVSNRAFWLQLVIITLINVIIVLVAVGVTVSHVHNSLRSVEKEIQAIPTPTPDQVGMKDNSLGGDIYIRWGRTTCPNNGSTEILYQGFAAGARYNHQGGPVDFLCLPADPEWGPAYNDAANSPSRLYGTEYEVPTYNPFSLENAPEGVTTVHQHDMPCAVCRPRGRATAVTLPARRSCPAGWRAEYAGYLMSGHVDQQRARALCVDGAPEALPGTEANVNGALLYVVEAGCGALPCPPYVNGREINCIVCSI